MNLWERHEQYKERERRREQKRRRNRKRWWYQGDHLENLCDCHDCRKRRKHGDVVIPSPQELRQRERDRENLELVTF